MHYVIRFAKDSIDITNRYDILSRLNESVETPLNRWEHYWAPINVLWINQTKHNAGAPIHIRAETLKLDNLSITLGAQLALEHKDLIA